MSERISRPSRITSSSGSLIDLHVEKPTAGGRMLARHNGQVVLVWGAIPGERVHARIERSGKGVLFAETVDVLTPSADRRPALRDWRCGGNVLSHIAYDKQLHIKAEIIRDAFARIARLPLEALPPVAASPEHGYRMRARLHVRGSRIGFMREESHDICGVGQTGQLLPATVAWIDAVQARLRDDSLDGLTSIEIAENIAATERACHLELEPATNAQRYASIAGEGVTGMSAQVLDSRAIVTLAGRPSISDSLGSLVLTRDVRAFFQGNRFLLDSFVQHVTTLVADGPVVDLYAGVGLFGLALVAGGRSDVTLVEGDPISGHDLEENARPYSGQARVERTSVEDFLRRAGPSTGGTFIVDPPRTGLSREVVHSVAELKPPRVIYVSCDVATLARDVRVLVDSGYALDRMSAFDLFPNTAHVETVCLLRREA